MIESRTSYVWFREGGHMTKLARWNAIMRFCQRQEKVEVSEMCETFQVSQATIRRDLQQMEDLGMITRFHGGARLNIEQVNEPPMMFKTDTNADAKNRVGRLAASLIKDNQMVYIDAGSSTYEMLDFITAKNINIVTIGVPHIVKLTQSKINTIVPGGVIRPSTQAITGIQTLKQLEEMFFDVAFLGVNGIHKLSGFTTSNEQEAEVKAAVMKHSNVSYLLADGSKFDKLYPVKYAKLQDGIVLSDDIPEVYKDLLEYRIIKNNPLQ
jgi:DeoR family fructose operon transcriptional repressor